MGHCLAQHRGTDLPGVRRGNGPGEEDPNMRAVARAGPLQNGGQPNGAARVEVGKCVERPRATIEIAHEKVASVIAQQGIQANRDSVACREV